LLHSETLFGNEFPRDYLTDNTLVLRIYFSSLRYIEMTLEPSYTIMALLSDLGGALGLLLGATLLTVYEVVEFTAELGFYIAAKWRHQMKTASSQQTNNF